MKLPRVFSIISASALLIVASACATGSKARVVELENGKTATIGTAKNEPDAVIAAVDRADQYCQDANKKPVFKNDVAAQEDEKKGPRFDFNKIPVIGEAFKEDEPKVIMEFACK